MPKPLIIVESPTKAKTISKIVGSGYVVESSKGHIRDLPKSKLGVDIENNFMPEYEIPDKAKEQIKKLTALAKEADYVILASDEDREGEAIAWHLTKALPLKGKKIDRIVFHEITKPAILAAIEHPRSIDMHMVDAQQARRVLDRLVGYKLSPLLWKKIAFGLSAGRVQSVAVRLVVEREEEIRKFIANEYWTIDGIFNKPGTKEEFEAKLQKVNGKSLEKLAIKNTAEAEKIIASLKKAEFKVTSVDTSETTKKTLAPFTTSTLQQEASKKFGYSAKSTMSIAQKLYEGIKVGKDHAGLITYMRTDSTNLAASAVSSIREYIKTEFGEKYLPESPKVYASKAKGAQEAHEAIRPADVSKTPESLEKFLDPQQLKLYSLIWERAVACQMADAKMEATGIDLVSGIYTFRATGSVILFEGFLKVYETAVKENQLPKLKEGENIDAKSISPNQHFTEPPARYTEAGLIKTLEEYGIGRPSTYAPTITTVQTRGYVLKREDKRFEPTDMGELVNKLLVTHFPEVVDIHFTARMEEDLDLIAEGKKEWQPVIGAFYLPFAQLIAKKDKEIDKKGLTEQTTNEICPESGDPLIIKIGRFGKFFACSGYPKCKYTREIDASGKPEVVEATDKVCKNCGKPMVIKSGRFGKFYACSDYPTCKTTEPIIIPIGLKCPKCNEGEIIEKKSKKGKIFYSCSRYPDCDQAYWNKPAIVDGKALLCPECKNIMLIAGKKGMKCSSCTYKADLPEELKITKSEE